MTLKQTLLTLCITFTTVMLSNAQKIEIEKVFGGYKYSQEGKRMTMKNLVNTMESNNEALELIKKARVTSNFSKIFSYSGGVLIGIPIGISVSGNDVNWTLAGVGVGLVAIAIPISTSANKKVKQAIELYNKSPDFATLNNTKTQYAIVTNANGIGLLMRF